MYTVLTLFKTGGSGAKKFVGSENLSVTFENGFQMKDIG